MTIISNKNIRPQRFLFGSIFWAKLNYKENFKAYSSRNNLTDVLINCIELNYR